MIASHPVMPFMLQCGPETAWSTPSAHPGKHVLLVSLLPPRFLKFLFWVTVKQHGQLFNKHAGKCESTFHLVACAGPFWRCGAPLAGCSCWSWNSYEKHPKKPAAFLPNHTLFFLFQITLLFPYSLALVVSQIPCTLSRWSPASLKFIPKNSPQAAVGQMERGFLKQGTVLFS